MKVCIRYSASWLSLVLQLWVIKPTLLLVLA